MNSRATIRVLTTTLPTYFLLTLIAATTILPALWMVLCSLHPPQAPLPSFSSVFSPQAWRPHNYWYVLTFPELPIWRFALNSAATSFGVIVFQLAICAPAAYAFARMRFPGRDALFAGFLVTMLVPPQVLIVPLFLIVQRLGWLDTYLGLIVPYQYISTAFGVFLLRQHFAAVPQSLLDAARLDGCGEWGAFWHVALPSCRAAVATVAAFAFVWSWTDFYWPLIATSSSNMRTLEVGLSAFKDAYGGGKWPLQMAAATLTLVPVLIFFLAMQRFFVRATVMSGVKE